MARSPLDFFIYSIADHSNSGRNRDWHVPRRPTVRFSHTYSSVSGRGLDFPFCSANIHYDLLRTGSVELTTNKILERGFLDAVRAPLSSHVLSFPLIALQPPEAYFTLYPRPSSANLGLPPASTPAAATMQIRPKETLISRFGLENRLSAGDIAPSPEQDAGGRAVWEDSAEKREASLRERKARMILAARQYVRWLFLCASLRADGPFVVERRMLAAQRIPAESSTA